MEGTWWSCPQACNSHLLTTDGSLGTMSESTSLYLLQYLHQWPGTTQPRRFTVITNERTGRVTIQASPGKLYASSAQKTIYPKHIVRCPMTVRFSRSRHFWPCFTITFLEYESLLRWLMSLKRNSKFQSQAGTFVPFKIRWFVHVPKIRFIPEPDSLMSFLPYEVGPKVKRLHSLVWFSCLVNPNFFWTTTHSHGHTLDACKHRRWLKRNRGVI